MRSVKLACVTAFCLLALGAGSAQAWEWSIEGESLEELEIKSEKISGEGGPFATLMPSLGLTVECKTGKIEGTIKPGGITEATIGLSGCKVPSSKFCTVAEPVTMKVIGEVAERNGATFVAFISQEEALATFLIEGPMCTLPEESVLTGMIAAEVEVGGESSEPTLAFSKAAAEGAETEAFFGEEIAFVDGEATAALSGTEALAAWGIFGKTALTVPGGLISFLAQPIGAEKTIKAENIGWSLSSVTMERAWIEQGGVKTSAKYTIFPIGGAAGCIWPPPPGAPPFETLNGSGTSCDIGIKLVSTAGTGVGYYVLEYGPYLIWASLAKVLIIS